MTAAYAPSAGRPFPAGGTDTGRGDSDAGDSDAATTLQRAAESGDAHAIKFADAAAEMWVRDPDPLLLAASRHATRLLG